MGVLLVSDGGVTLSSINDPSLNIQNPQAPINQVSAPLLGGFGLMTIECCVEEQQRVELSTDTKKAPLWRFFV